VRRTAASLLSDFHADAAPAMAGLVRMLETSSEDVDRFVARDALANIGPQAVPTLVELLKSPQPKVRWEALQAFDLSFTAETAPAAWEPVLRAVSDPDATVRSAALGAADSIAPSADLSRPLILAAVDDNDPGVRTMAAALLGRPASASVAGRAALIKLSADSENQVRLLAIESLGECGQRGQLAEAAEPAAEVLAKIVAAPPDQELTDAALRSLAQMGTSAKSAAPALVGLIERGDEVYIELAIDALAGERWRRQCRAGRADTGQDARGQRRVQPTRGHCGDRQARAQRQRSRAGIDRRAR
jgi:HEAT repeat protein